ncbi:MAG: MIR domain-containing protein [Acidobacteriota bacterium]
MKHFATVFAVALAISFFGLSFAKLSPIKAGGEIDIESAGDTVNTTATEIKCGDTLRITHSATSARLHSHPLNYGHPGSSCQQQITAYQGMDYNDLWIVRSPCSNPVRDGGEIKLEHAATRRYLHSHPGIPSPVNPPQQEVTGWGGGSTTDRNDVWKVEVEGGGAWTTDKQVRFIHVATNSALHSHPGRSHPEWTNGQQEVTAYTGRDSNDFWKASYTTETAPYTPPLPPKCVPPAEEARFPVKFRQEDNFGSPGKAPSHHMISEVTISKNGRIDVITETNNHVALVGNCAHVAIWLLDNKGNVLTDPQGKHDFCVGPKSPLVPGGKPVRKDLWNFAVSPEILKQAANVGILQMDKADGDPLARTVAILRRVNDVLQACPECIKLGKAAAAK